MADPPLTWGIWCTDHEWWVATGPWSEHEAWHAMLEADSTHPMRLELREIGRDPDSYGGDGDVPCPKCEGDGACSQCDEECRKCDGTGWISEEQDEADKKAQRERREARDKRFKELAEQAAAL